MPKIKIKPSPLQARILRALRNSLGLFIGWPGRGRAYWSGSDEAERRRELGNPRNATMRKLVTEGWIDTAPGQQTYYTLTDLGRAQLDDLTADDFKSKTPDLTAGEIFEILKKEVFPEPWWMLVRELAIGDFSGSRRVDAYALKLISGATIPPRPRTIGITGARQLTSWSLEIKISRSDFLSEINYPRKRERAMEICNRFAFVAPVGVIPSDQVPEGCGLLEIYSDKSIRVTIVPPYEIADRPQWPFVAALARAMMK